MSIFSRSRKHPQHEGMKPFVAGVIGIVVLALAVGWAFTKYNPFANPYDLTATFDNANNLKPRSPVRMAGVEVGKVTKIEPIGATGAAVVSMEIKDEGLPIHEDAVLKVRGRVFLEGNFFIELSPGSPSSPIREDGAKPIPMTQTFAPVQLGAVLSALQSDTREDLKTFLKEYSKGLEGEGARGFNQSLRNGGPTFRDTAIVNDATLGIDRTRDIQRLLKGQQRTFKALATNEEALKGLVTNLSVFTGALAREDVALEASIPALRDTLKVGSPALAALNGALPSLRAFAVDALPGVRSSGPTLREALPFITQLRALVGEDELQSAARELRAQLPRFSRLFRRTVPLSEQGRALSACTNNVLVPFINLPFADPDFQGNDGTVNQKLGRGLVGLSGESRQTDGNQSYFHVSSTPDTDKVRPAPPTDGGSQPPPRRPDVPCETQELPSLQAPGASYTPAGLLTPFPNDYAAAAVKAHGKAPKGLRDSLFSLLTRRDRIVKERRAKLKARPGGIVDPR